MSNHEMYKRTLIWWLVMVLVMLVTLTLPYWWGFGVLLFFVFMMTGAGYYCLPLKSWYGVDDGDDL